MAKPTSYLVSLPERTVRATAALGGGLIAETSRLVLPGVVRHSRMYQATVGRLLRIVIELVGGVEGVYAPDDMPVKELAMRKTAGNVIEAAGVIAAGWSPLWLLAAAADITNGTRVYLGTLVAELKTVRALPQDAEIATVEELLAALEGTSAVMADTIDVPPLNVADMRKTWQALREQVAELPDAADLARLYQGLQAVSTREGLPLLTVSATIAAGAIRAGVRLGDVHVFGYYRETLAELAAEGLLPYLRRIARPYFWGAVKHFDPAAPTLTQRFI
jgi:hypothetical protein